MYRGTHKIYIKYAFLFSKHLLESNYLFSDWIKEKF